ncbi:Flavodoxin/ferredoxin--NADP reductase [Buchnera aphidicola (Symydobius americanus)]
MTEWVKGKVIQIEKFEHNLFKLIINAPISKFIAGQFSKLSIKKNNQKRIQKAYSYVNAPKEKNLEFFIKRIPLGKMTTELYKLNPGDNIDISKNSFGFFTIHEIPDKEVLWMFATGTAIGPFCSILNDGTKLNQFKKIILIYAVRYSKELIYLPFLKKMKIKYQNQLEYEIIVSGEKYKNSLSGRIPYLLYKNSIEKKIGCQINPKNSHVMLCGNPNMIKETESFLIKHRGLKKHLRRTPGNISNEHYW